MIDEVYQAALEAGSGGIRWNSVTNWVQLMDQNKNWVDWRYYDPNYSLNAEVDLVATTVSNSTTAYTITQQNMNLSKRGLYCVSMFGHTSPNPTLTIDTTGTVLNHFEHRDYNGPVNIGMVAYKEEIIYSNGSATLSFTIKASYGPHAHVYYIGPFSSISNPEEYLVGDNINQISKKYTTHNQFIHFVLHGITRYSRNITTTNIDSKYIHTWDPSKGNIYSAAVVNLGGTVTCTGTAGALSSNVGNFYSTSYTLVE